MTCGAVSVATGETGTDWQAVSKIKTNRQMRCFIWQLYHLHYECLARAHEGTPLMSVGDR
jgi:hypothetical protein